MFSLNKARATIRSFNPRSEKHGQEETPAADLKLEFNVTNLILSEFGSQLRSAMYWNSGEPPVQKDLADVPAPVTDLPNLRCPEIVQPIALEYEGAGYTVTIDHGLGGKSNLVIEDAQVNNIRAECKEGGTVTLTLRVQFENNERLAGKLALLINHEVKVDVAPPAEQERIAA